MRLSTKDLSDLADLAMQAAEIAGAMIACSRPSDIEYKAAGATPASQVVTEIDRRSEDLILDVLTPSLERFELGLLTEERQDDGGRFTADNFWCIDPLDGTLPFIEGVPGSAVSIALVSREGTSLVGVVYDPATATLWHAIIGGGVFRSGRPWSRQGRPEADVLSVFADRSFLRGEDHDEVLRSLGDIAQEAGLAGVRIHATAGAVMNACGVLENTPACYFKVPGPSGGGSVWDFAATACLFREAGAVATDIRGGALDLNRSDTTFMNHRGVIFASDESLASRLRQMS